MTDKIFCIRMLSMANTKILIEDVWKKALEVLKDKLPQSSYDAWIINLVPNRLEENEFSVRTGHRIAIEMMAQHNKIISQTLSEIIGKDVIFKMIYDSEVSKLLAKKTKKLIENTEPNKNKYENLMQMHSSYNLNLKFKFDNFIVGSNSELAYAGALAVAKKPGKTSYNPLFIYGNSGVGKTHLIQAIGHYVLDKGLKVKYCSSEEFVNDFVKAVAKGLNKGQNSRDDKMNSLRQKYRNCDVLLIDDIQFIENKERTQVEIFNTFESLYNSGKQIVFASDRPPSAMTFLADRLKTRFEGGLLVDIQPPDIETRMAILESLSTDENLSLSNEIITFLAENYSANVRELKGAFNKIKVFNSLNENELSIEIVKKALNFKENQKVYTNETIISEVASYFNVSEEDILGSCRMKNIANARQVAIYLIRKLTKDSFPSIGNFFDKKHSTIIYSYETMQEQLKINNILKSAVTEIQKRLE